MDEARIIKNEKLIINNGLPAPQLISQRAKQELKVLSDSVNFYFNEANFISGK